MAREPDNSASGFETEQIGGLLSGFLADEHLLDRSSLWRVGAWGATSVCAVVLALYANQSSIGSRREHLAAMDLARQAQQLQSVAKQDENETRRLSSAIDTLKRDQDRLYSRFTVLEQGLESVTGAVARQTASAAAVAQMATPSDGLAEVQPRQPSAPQPTPSAAPVVTTTAAAPKERPVSQSTTSEQVVKGTPSPQEASGAPAAPSSMPVVSSKAMAAPAEAGTIPTEPAASAAEVEQPEMVASTQPALDSEPEKSQTLLPAVPVQRTEFGIDVGSANSVSGLRALWLGLLKSRANAPLRDLRPIIVIKEGANGFGMQLRLVAGPFADAAGAAKICAVLTENNHSCETSVFEGQRLSMEPQTPTTSTKPAAGHRRGSGARAAKTTEEPAPKPAEPSTLSSLFRR